MLGLGETLDQVQATLRDLRAHDVDMVTVGQYLQPTPHHHPVLRYWTRMSTRRWKSTVWRWVSATLLPGPMVRSSYHADHQAKEAGLGFNATVSLGSPAVSSTEHRERNTIASKSASKTESIHHR